MSIFLTSSVCFCSCQVIIYNVRLEGSPDFTIEQKEVRLEPKDLPGSRVSFPIKFVSRFSKQVNAQIYFTSKTADQSTRSCLNCVDETRN
jgi:hypothetical protein